MVIATTHKRVKLQEPEQHPIVFRTELDSALVPESLVVNFGLAAFLVPRQAIKGSSYYGSAEQVAQFSHFLALFLPVVVS